MADDFDPYREWLNIDRAAAPLNHYRLLGLPAFEKDRRTIEAAADRQMAEVRKHQTGPRGRWTQKLLNEITAAKLCLLDARSKQAYDAALAKSLPLAPPAPGTARPVARWAPQLPLAAPAYVAPPPRIAESPAPQGVSVLDDEELPHPWYREWWVPFGLFFLVVLAGASAGLYRVVTTRAARVPPPAEAEIVSPAPEPQAARKGHREALPYDEDEAVVIAQEGSGDVNFPLSAAVLSEGLARSDREGKTVVTGWTNEAYAAWRFRVVRPAAFRVELIYTAQGSGGAQWNLTVGEEQRTRDLEPSDDSGQPYTDEFTWRVSRGGEQTLELQVVDLPEEADVQLHSIRLKYLPVSKGR